MVSTQLKNISQIGSFPQVGVKIRNLWNHHLDMPAGVVLHLDGYQIWLRHPNPVLGLSFWASKKHRQNPKHHLDVQHMFF